MKQRRYRPDSPELALGALDVLPDPCVLVAGAGEIVFGNAAWRRDAGAADPGDHLFATDHPLLPASERVRARIDRELGALLASADAERTWTWRARDGRRLRATARLLDGADERTALLCFSPAGRGRAQPRSDETTALAALTSLREAVVAWDRDGFVTLWNDAAERLYETPREQALGRKVDEVLGRDGIGRTDWDELGRIPEGRSLHVRKTLADGSRRRVQIGLAPVRSSEGAIVGACQTARDVTQESRAKARVVRERGVLERAKAMQASYVAELDLQSLVDQMAETMARHVGADFAVVFYDEVIDESGKAGSFRSFGIARDRLRAFVESDAGRVLDPLIEGRMVEVVDEDDGIRETLGVRHLLAAPVRGEDAEMVGALLFGSQAEGGFREETRQLVQIVAEQSGPLLDNARAHTQVVSELADRHEILRSLEESRHRYLQLFQAANDAVVVFAMGEAGTPQLIEEHNDRATELLGYASEELRSRTLLDFAAENERGLLARLRDLLANQNAVFEARLVTRSGIPVPVEISGRVIELAGRKHALLILRDVGARAQVEETLRAKEAHLRKVLDGLAAFVCVLDTEGVLVGMNRAASEIVGLSLERDAGRAIYDTAWWSRSDDARLRLCDALATAQQGQSVRYDEEFHDGADEVRAIDLCLAPLTDDQGRVTHLIASGIDITAKRRMEWALERSEERLQGTVESATVGIGHVGACGRWLLVNERLCDILGYGRSELTGMPFKEVVHPRDLGEDADQLEAVLQGRLPIFTTEKILMDRSGHAIWVELTASRPRDPGADYVVMVIEDITERRKTAEELAKTREDAETARRVKKDFLANVSHELRTPMNAILGMTDLALGERLDGKVRSYLETSRNSAQQLMRLLNDLLDFSKLDAGKFLLDSKPFHLRRLLETTLKGLSLQAFAHGNELNCHVLNNVPDHLVGDDGRVRQVVTNLVTNAVKFTTNGEISVRVSVQSLTEHETILHFSVRDTGVGISPADQERIFTPFTQADTSSTRNYTGTGLGLSIALELIRLMSGRLWVESRVGEGSTFHFTARFARTSPDQRDDGPEGDVPEDLRSHRVLIVDDNATNRAILRDTLKGWDVPHGLAEDAAGALEELRRATGEGRPYSVVLLDALMPERDGIDFLRDVSRTGGSPDARVIVLSSADRNSLIERSSDVEVAAVLEKPVSRGDLLNALSRSLGLREQSSIELERDANPPKRALNILVAEDIVANRVLVESVLRRRGHHVGVANNGLEVLQRWKSKKWDMILMDVQMPEMDGLEATRRIRREEARTGDRIAIVAMTAHAMQGDRERCIAVGMDAYISKPIDAREVVQLVESLCDSSDDRGAAGPGDAVAEGDGQAPVAISVGDDLLFDAITAIRRLDGDESLFRDMVRFFVADAPGLIEEMEAAARSGAADRAMRAAHSLKGLAATVGGEQVRARAYEAEERARFERLDSLLQEILPDLRQSVQALAPLLEAYLAQG